MSAPTLHWAILRFRADCHDRIAREPLATYPATPASNIWIAQQAMVTLQKRGHRVYMDCITIYEKDAA